MFKQLLLGSALATAALAAPIDWTAVDYSSVDFSKVDYSGVDFAKASTNAPFFVLWGTAPSLIQRVDPVMAPGKATSQHAHAFTGAGLVTPDVTSKDLQAFQGCSTFGPKADKSLYWNPLLYFKNKDGSFARVPEKAGWRKMYYMYPSIDTSGVEEFPQDFRMISGDPTCNNKACVVNPAPTWTCFTSKTDMSQKVEGYGFPKGITSCPGGLQALQYFPNCWNGNAFDEKNPHDHVAFQTNGKPDGDGACPASHPRKLPAMKAEVTFIVDQFNGLYDASDNPWVLAFGDNTGYGWHFDYINGWTPGVLQKVMKTCRLGDGSNDQTLTDPACFGANAFRSQAEKDSCTLKPTSNENVGWSGVKDTDGTKGGQIPALPGCQGFFTGGPVTMNTCPAGSSTPVGTGSSNSQPAASTTTANSVAKTTPASTVNKAVAAPIAALQVSSENSNNNANNVNTAGTVHVDPSTGRVYTTTS